MRAAGLALRSRVPGLRRAGVDSSGLIRTWAARGTVHLIDPADWPWLHATVGQRNRVRFDAQMSKRGDYDAATGMLGDLVAVLRDRPLDRAGLLAGTGRPRPPRPGPALGQRPHALGGDPGPGGGPARRALPGGRAAARGGRRPGAGHAGPPLPGRVRAGGAADLASWSGLPLGTARRALAAAGDTEAAGDLLALPGTLDAAPPPAPPALLLAAFDTTMLGYRTRAPLVAAADDRHILPGGGMLRPAVLIDGVAAGTWGPRGQPAPRCRSTGSGGLRSPPELQAEQLTSRAS